LFVNIKHILYKLIHYDVRGEVLNIIKSLYNNIKLRVKHTNELSEAFNCYVGVFQGECLPFLCSIYVNDLEEYFILNKFKGIDLGLLNLC